MTKQMSTGENYKGSSENQKGSRDNLKGASANEKGSKENLKGTTSNQKGSPSVALPGGKGVHIGYTLGRLLKMQEISTTELALRMGISGKSARAMLKKKYLHATTLVKISEVLKHDVVRYLYLPKHLPGNTTLKEKVEKLEQKNAALKKENEILKELNTLLREKK